MLTDSDGLQILNGGKVNDKVELNRSAPETVLNNQKKPPSTTTR
jgi:hypothetical protein